MPRSIHGGRHELGQNFLTHRPTITRLTALVAETSGPILEIGAGDGALTRPLAELRRPITAIDIDEHHIRRLQRALPHVTFEHADALTYPLRTPILVGNIPFHLTTPLLRRLLASGGWTDAFLLTQWEVARKRSGVGGSTMMTAQAAPWFNFTLQGRVPSWGFSPRPSVDGGILQIQRRQMPLIPFSEQARYHRFVRAVFTGHGGSLDRIIRHSTGHSRGRVVQALRKAKISARNLPRDLSPEQWVTLWSELR